MTNKKVAQICLALGLFCFPLLSTAEIVTLTPQQPKWGETVRITYDPAAEEAGFLLGDDIFTVYFADMEDGSVQKWKKMEKDGKLFSCEIPIEKGTAFLTFYFITPEKWDRKAELSTMVFKEDGLPARRAYQQKMMASSKEEYLSAFKKEREMYPDNYAVYRDKWFIQGAYDKGNQILTIKREMEILKNPAGKKTPGLLYSLAYGYMLLDDEKAAREILHVLVKNHSQSFYTGYALSNYDYQVFSKKIKGEGPEEVNDLKPTLLVKNPLSHYARTNILYLILREDVSLETIAAVCKPWMEEEPDNPLPYYTQASAFIEKNSHLDQAAVLLDKTINLLLQGKLRLYADISGFRTQNYLPRCYKMSSKIYFQTGNYARALADIKTAQSLEKESRPELYEVEAEIWLKLNAYQNAEKAILEATRLGSEKAKTVFEEMYRLRHGTRQGFEEYFASVVKGHISAAAEEKEAAPEFEVQTLAGKTLRLSDLKGKVVVLNFWFIGCAPCRVEMPGLNKLTDEFKDEDVVFIAFSLDEADRIKEFLTKKAFIYQIVPSAGEIATLYGAKVYPTHILINKKGQIEYFLTGGSETRHEQLRPLIKNLLM